MEKNHRRVSALLAGALLGFAVSLRAKTSDWDSPTLWSVDTDDQSSLSVRPVEGIDGLRLELKYTLLGAGHRWVQMKREWDPAALFDGRPLTFLFRANGTATMEIKLVDQDGSNFICRYPLKQYGAKWEPVVLYRDSFEYGWGGNATLDRPKQLAIAISGTAENGVVYIDEIGLGQRFADFVTRCKQESIGDTAADDQLIDLGRQGFEDGEFGRNFGACHNRHERACRCAQCLAQRVEFGGQQRPGAHDGRIFGDALRGGFGAMCRAESIIHIDIAQTRHFLRQCIVVLFLAFIDAAVFQQDHFAWPHLHAFQPVLHQAHLNAHQLAQPFGNGSQ